MPNYEKELTQMQKKFAENYLSNGMQGTLAAIKAGYSECGAAVRAVELINNPRVNLYMQERVGKIAKRLEMPLDYLLGKLKFVIDTAIDESEGLNKDFIGAGMSAIKEVNLIQGNYSAEKRVNINVNGDEEIKRVREKTEKAIAENRQEY